MSNTAAIPDENNGEHETDECTQEHRDESCVQEPPMKRLKLDEEELDLDDGKDLNSIEQNEENDVNQSDVDDGDDVNDEFDEKDMDDNLGDDLEPGNDENKSESDGDEDDDDLDDDEMAEKDIDMDEDMKAGAFLGKTGVDTLNPMLTPAMATLQQFFPFNNVTLEPLETTKQAVAQFAENNLAPSELVVLQGTLYSLQQQQLLQLQLIQQLQQQLINGMNQQGAPLPPGPMPSILKNSPHIPTTTTSPMITPPGVSSKSAFDPVVSSDKKVTGSRSTSSSPDLHDDNQVPQEKPARSVPAPDPTTPTNSSMFVSDDPFFKHKCRYCYKVFGSDSALQIHIRSHTGERPFKCNICGNRFSTRGNLKVHFTRHRAKYPHIRMNPNPVPEHLDRIAPSPLVAPSSLPMAMGPYFGHNGMSMPAPPMDRIREPKRETESSPPPPVESPVTHPSMSLSSSSSGGGPTPAVGSEPPSLTSPDMTSVNANTHNNNRSSPDMPRPPHSLPMPVPLPSSLPTMSLPVPHMSMDNPFMRGSILPSKTEDPLEEFMECKKSETSKLQQLVENIETKLTDPNQCVICHRVLSCKSALQMHYRIHTGERPFRCKICGRSFTTKGNLKTHMGVHRAKPPLRMLHQCPVCHKQFTNSLVLQQHIRMHTTEMNHMGYPTPHPDFSSPYQPLNLYPPSSQHPPVLPGGELDLSKPRDSERDRETRSPRHESRSSSASPASADEEENEQEQHEDVRSPSPKSDRGAPPSFQHYLPLEPDRGIPDPPTSMYSTSLAALEERVRAMDASMAQPRYNLSRPLDMRHHFPEQKMKPDTPVSFSSMHNDRRSVLSPASHSGEESEHQGERSKDHRGSPDSRVGSTPPTVSPYPYPTSSGASSPGANFGALDLSQGERPTSCNVCLKTFACRSALDIHYRSHTKERPYMCEVCDRGFSTRGNMRQHMLTHKIRDLPSQAFGEEDGEQDSQQSNKSRGSDYPVKSEPSTPTTPNMHSSSSSSHHSSDNSPFVRRHNPKHQCQICMKPFSSASALQIHIRTHTGDKPFKCTVCGKAFTTKGNLKVHMGTHMWNNGPSRRGRRIAMEPPIPMPTKEADFMFAHRSPSELYFPYPPFANGLSPKLNEIPVIQSMNGTFPHLGVPTSSSADYLKMAYNPLMSMATPAMHNGFKDSVVPPRGAFSNKDGSESVKNNNEGEEDSKAKEENSDEPSPSWSWKTTCHLCSKVCASVPALEAHLQSHVLNHNNSEREEQKKSVMT